MSKNILLVTSSLFGAESKSRQIAVEFVDALRDSNRDAHVVERDLNADQIPHLNLDHLGALGTPAAQRSPGQQQSVAFGDALIEEVEDADTIVIAAPMYNFTIASTLKAWIDHIVRAGRTFRYTDKGPEGLLKHKQVFVVTGRGGVYSGDSPIKGYDFQEPYLKAVLGFLGLDTVNFIHVEGLKVSPEAAAEGLARARAAIGKTAPAAHAA